MGDAAWHRRHRSSEEQRRRSCTPDHVTRPIGRASGRSTGLVIHRVHGVACHAAAYQVPQPLNISRERCSRRWHLQAATSDAAREAPIHH